MPSRPSSLPGETCEVQHGAGDVPPLTDGHDAFRDCCATYIGVDLPCRATRARPGLSRPGRDLLQLHCAAARFVGAARGRSRARPTRQRDARAHPRADSASTQPTTSRRAHEPPATPGARTLRWSCRPESDADEERHMTAGASPVTRELQVTPVTGTIGAELSGVDLAERPRATRRSPTSGPRCSRTGSCSSATRTLDYEQPGRVRAAARHAHARPPDDPVAGRQAADGRGRLRQGRAGRRLAHRRDVPRPAGAASRACAAS